MPVAGSYTVVASVGGCPSAPSAALAVVLAAVPAALAQQVRLYPNPAHGTATLVLPAKLEATAATLHDALGRTVRCYTLPASAELHPLDVNGLPAGVYALRVASAQGAVVRRLVVE